MILSIDVMGGDKAPDVILEGIDLVLKDHPDLRFLLHGDERKIKPLLSLYPKVAQMSETYHTDKMIAMDEAPAQALRKSGRESSMWRALESVRDHKAQVAVSAGNTGALMGMTKLVLSTLPGIDRPVLAGRWPSGDEGLCLCLDLGATVSPSAKQLVQFAVMGIAASAPLLGISQPKVGLLNVGSEDIKGTMEVKEAAQICQKLIPEHFYGYIEGDKIMSGVVDVIVTDGFSGNIALKVTEGAMHKIFQFLMSELSASWTRQFAKILLRHMFKDLRARFDPAKYNGAVFLGLEGLAVKSHGGCTAQSFASAIIAAKSVADADLARKIAKTLPPLGLDKISQLSNYKDIEDYKKQKEHMAKRTYGGS